MAADADQETRAVIPNYRIIQDDEGEFWYELEEDIAYYSDRYDGWIKCHTGYRSDGATGAFDIHSMAWWIHDKICDDACFEDGKRITAYQAAQILSDILSSEGRWARALYWKWSTFAFGCTKTRNNGWFRDNDK